jgi:hypothetical protein
MFKEIRERADKIVTMIDQGRCWITPISRTDVETLLQFADEAMILIKMRAESEQEVFGDINETSPKETRFCRDFLKRWEGK